MEAFDHPYRYRRVVLCSQSLGRAGPRGDIRWIWLRGDQLKDTTTAAGESRSKDTGLKLGRDLETGQFLEGHEGMGGRPPGSQNKFPTHYIRTMKLMIAGRIKELVKGEKDPVTISKIVAQFYFRREGSRSQRTR